jgi:hypothetical protein
LRIGCGDGLEGGEGCRLGGVGYGLLDGGRIGIGSGVEEAVEHLDELVAVGFLRFIWGGEFGDGSDESELLVEDNVFD